ncbi:hypothetical protein EDB85DRAFT_1894061 [Lactarius pseudohatsudake]|nr:hypothetical protein EDB85DRAFT_1894061 [Lactarius pseudohatsudake]
MAALLLLPLLPVHAHAAIVFCTLLCRTSRWSCHKERTVVGTASGVIAIIVGLAGVPASVLFPLPPVGVARHVGVALWRLLRAVRGGGGGGVAMGWRRRPRGCMLQGGGGGGDGDLAP